MIEKILEERKSQYGEYIHVANTTTSLFGQLGFKQDLNAEMFTSLFMICNKLARIVNGDPYYEDSWRDIAGYATLVADSLHSSAANEESEQTCCGKRLEEECSKC